jgi:hypothetical protein
LELGWGEPAGIRGALLRLGKLRNGSYRVRYQAVDRAANQRPAHELAFNVNTYLQI